MMEISLIKRASLSAVPWIPSDYTLHGCSASVRPHKPRGDWLPPKSNQLFFPLSSHSLSSSVSPAFTAADTAADSRGIVNKQIEMVVAMGWDGGWMRGALRSTLTGEPSQREASSWFYIVACLYLGDYTSG